MNNLKRFFTYISNMKIRTKFILSYSILIILPLCLVGIIYYFLSMSVISKIACENTFKIVKTNNQIIDNMLTKVEESTLSMIRDSDLFDLFSDKNFNPYYMDRQVTKSIDKYLSRDSNILSAQIVTGYSVFGNNTSVINPLSVKESSVYLSAINAAGKLEWIPTYDFTKMFGNEKLGQHYKDKYIFSAARVLNSFNINNGILVTLDADVEKPILIVNFKEDFLRKQFEKNLPIKSTEFFVIDTSGHVITHNNGEEIGIVQKPFWLSEAISNASGTNYIDINGKKVILCYDTMNSTGWISVVLIPVDSLMEGFLPIVKKSTIYITLVFVLLSMLLAFIISGRISKPIKKLLKAMKRVGEGDFDIRVSDEKGDEFGYLSRKFDKMNAEIKKLIEENYIVKIRDKESQIMALNLQLNPHFLYNTLNIINCMLIEDSGKEASEMIIKLRDMLIYSVKNKKELVVFKDDFGWLKNYIHIMSKRYEDKYTICFDIDTRIYNTYVPKLFLQPLIENAIIHGFEETDNGGVILITGSISDNKRIFTVSDNGKGIDKDTCEKILSRKNTSIGINNIDSRIKLIYGQEYGVFIKSENGKGAEVSVIIPFDDATI